ncbi:MAG TPA: protein kinase [Pyrinomonadaceae bacterium]|jgi:non-specific serine/threonine protein kinase/serine/threonine-protein kinase
MRKEEWREVEELLDAALELAPEERRKFLEEVGGRAPELRREIESLLVCEEGANNFLAAPALAFSADFFDAPGNDAHGADMRAGQTVGHYRIRREIGRGGMGAVFLAERSDGEFEQQVALKIVRRSFADSELARRFRRERQILASLNHPNIARLLDGGMSADGEPFFAMEYVEGVRIDDYCDAHDLPNEARLSLFLGVCRGVAYAHQNLVVHRDIKPSNILVNAEGTPKLLDFGIAKLLDADQLDEHTRTDFRAFTPDYASPEQVSGGHVTTASDVYSLGVLLREILGGAKITGRASSQKEFVPGVWRSVTPGQKTRATNLPTNRENGDGRARTTRRRFVAAELENIIAMARREEPARRYASVAQLAEDVQRYLDGRPTRAQRDSFTYRAGKFIRRNKLSVGAGLIVALSLLVGTAFALWQARVARGERDRAERRFADVRQLSNALLTEIAPKIERLPGSTEARQAVLTQSLKYLDSLAYESADDLSLQSELASAYEKIGDLQGNPTNPNLSALTDALASYEKANAMRRALLARAPRDFEQRRLLADNYRSLGDIRWQANESAESLKNSEAALSLYTELLAGQRGSNLLRISLARTHLSIGKSHATNERYPEAISSFQKAVTLLAEAERPSPEQKIEISMLLADAHKQIGNSLSWDGKQPEAEAEMAQAVSISESLIAANPHDNRLRTSLHQTYMTMSSVYEESNDPLSNEYAFKALKVIEETVARDPADLRARHELAQTYSLLGVTLENIGRNGESILYLEKAVRILQEIMRNETKNRRFKYDLATALTRLGDAVHKQRRFRDSLAALQNAAAVLTDLTNSDPTDNASLRNLANAHDSMAKSHEALAARATTGAEKQSHHQQAKQNYTRALELLHRLEAKNALSTYDRKSLEEMQTILQKYDR